MAKYEIGSEEGAKHRNKAEPLSHKSGKAAELDDSRAGQTEVMLRMQQTCGNRCVQRLANGAGQPILHEDIIGRIEAQKGSGERLAPETRSDMDSVFGQDLSDVQIHTNPTAGRLTEQLGASAFTTGKDIFFREGAYRPNSRNGRKLLGHELAHVVQQDSGTVNARHVMDDLGSSRESEANTAGEAAASGERVTLGPAASVPPVQLQKDGPIDEKEPPKTVKVTLTVAGSGEWKDLDFTKAVSMIRAYTEVDRKSCEQYVKKLNEDQWIVSFWAKALGSVKPPTYEMWIKPIYALMSASGAMKAGKVDAARAHLERAVEAYNDVRQAWVEYRGGMIKGAERGVMGMKIAITVMGAATTAGVGSWLPGSLSTGTRLLAEAGVSAGVKLLEETATAGGELAYGLEQTVDIARIARSAGTAFTSSLVGGALSKGFLAMLTPKIVRTSAASTLLPSGYSGSQELISSFVGGTGATLLEQAVKRAVDKLQNKERTTRELLEEIVDQFVSLGAGEAFKASLEAAVKR